MYIWFAGLSPARMYLRSNRPVRRPPVYTYGRQNVTLKRKQMLIAGLCRQHGFSLIELLVVIAIISLLSSILLPSLQRAKELAGRVACLGNIRQVGIVMQQYTIDFRGKYPRQGGGVWCGNPYPDGYSCWYTILPGNTFENFDYISDQKPVSCIPSYNKQLWKQPHYIYGTALLHYLFMDTPGAGEGAEHKQAFRDIVQYEQYGSSGHPYQFVPSSRTPSSTPISSCWFRIPAPEWGRHGREGDAVNILRKDNSAYTFQFNGEGPPFQ